MKAVNDELNSIKPIPNNQYRKEEGRKLKSINLKPVKKPYRKNCQERLLINSYCRKI